MSNYKIQARFRDREILGDVWTDLDQTPFTSHQAAQEWIDFAYALQMGMIYEFRIVPVD